MNSEWFKWAIESTVLHEYYPRWIQNHRNSARFLRNDKEYLEFMKTKCPNLDIDPPEKREIEAKWHEEQAEGYEQVLKELNK